MNTQQQRLNQLANGSARSTMAVINAISQRGGFRGEELLAIGQLWDQCTQIVQIVESINQAEATAAADVEANQS